MTRRIRESFPNFVIYCWCILLALPPFISRLLLIYYIDTIYARATIIAVCMCLPIYIVFVERFPISKHEFLLRTFYRHLVYGNQKYDDRGNKLPPINEPSLSYFVVVYLSLWFSHPFVIVFFLNLIWQ